MDFGKLSSSEKMAVYAAVVVVVTGLISVVNDWGTLMLVAVLAGVAALVVVFAPQIMPGTRMPGSNGSLLVVLGGLAVLIWVVVLIDNLEWVAEHIANLDTLQFTIGLIAAAVLTWTGWQTLQAEGGRMRFGTAGESSPQAPAAAPASSPAPPPAAPPPAASEPMAEPAPQAAAEPAAEDEDEGGAPTA
ncbi:MAG TPA: hypothetical protein VF071_09520 [Candidatus Limnocylindria bacterium]